MISEQLKDNIIWKQHKYGEDFAPGGIHPQLYNVALKRPAALTGDWFDWMKQSDMQNKILERLGVIGLKRRLVSGRSNRFELQLRTKVPDSDPDEDEGPTETSENTSDGMRTRPSSPRPLSWWQKQHFPLKRFLESEFVGDGATVEEQTDPETGKWTSRALWIQGLLVQRRHSTTHNVTMYETRVAIRRQDLDQFWEFDSSYKVVQGKERECESGDKVSENCEEEEEQVCQLLVWKLVDHNDNDREMVCHCFLKRRQ